MSRATRRFARVSRMRFGQSKPKIVQIKHNHVCLDQAFGKPIVCYCLGCQASRRVVNRMKTKHIPVVYQRTMATPLPWER